VSEVTGFFYPRTATGRASLVPPPWHYRQVGVTWDGGRLLADRGYRPTRESLRLSAAGAHPLQSS
jgi:hypothetical protein